MKVTPAFYDKGCRRSPFRDWPVCNPAGPRGRRPGEPPGNVACVSTARPARFPQPRPRRGCCAHREFQEPRGLRCLRACWLDEHIAGYEHQFGSVSRQTVRPTLDAARVGAGMRVLDACTGPGMLALLRASAAPRSSVSIFQPRRSISRPASAGGPVPTWRRPRFAVSKRQLRCGRVRLWADARSRSRTGLARNGARRSSRRPRRRERLGWILSEQRVRPGLCGGPRAWPHRRASSARARFLPVRDSVQDATALTEIGLRDVAAEAFPET